MSQGSVTLVATQNFAADFTQRNLTYGFTLVYRKALLDIVKWQSVKTHTTDYCFVNDLRAAGKKLKYIQDELGLVVHVIHESNSSSCYPQYLLPPFLANKLFPEFAAYLKAVGV